MYTNSVCTRLDPTAWGSHTYCTSCYGTFQFAYTAGGTCTASYDSVLYRTIQQVWENSFCATLDQMALRTGQRIVGIVHLLYEALWHLPVCVCSLWSLYGVVCLGAV